METDLLLEVNDLEVSFKTYGGEVQAVRGAGFTLKKGETIAIVGESGCGKSVTAQSIMGIVPRPAGRIKGGKIFYRGIDMTEMTPKEIRALQGSEIAMIFQDPMTSLNPTITVGEQITEGIRRHDKATKKDANKRAVAMLKEVGIANPELRMKQYPHQFSGGMRQRIMIAMALVCNPSILIADEPTTALDVTIQAQIMQLFGRLQKETGISVILITHDLGVVAQVADYIHVMYAGKIVESGRAEDLFYKPQHPYTKGLLASIPRLDNVQKESLVPIPGTPPDLFAPPQGCPFVQRCEQAMEACRLYEPPVTKVRSTHNVSCWLQDPRSKKVRRSGRPTTIS